MAAVCPGELGTGLSGEALCSMAWEVEPPFHVDFEAAAEPFSVGFLLMASFWVLGKGVAVVIDLVRH